MTDNPPNYSPEDWLKRAAELREHARDMKDRELRREVETIVRAYERLAAHAAKRRNPGTEKPAILQPPGQDDEPSR